MRRLLVLLLSTSVVGVAAPAARAARGATLTHGDQTIAMADNGGCGPSPSGGYLCGDPPPLEYQTPPELATPSSSDVEVRLEDVPAELRVEVRGPAPGADDVQLAVDPAAEPGRYVVHLPAALADASYLLVGTREPNNGGDRHYVAKLRVPAPVPAPPATPPAAPIAPGLTLRTATRGPRAATIRLQSTAGGTARVQLVGAGGRVLATRRVTVAAGVVRVRVPLGRAGMARVTAVRVRLVGADGRVLRARGPFGG